jgi:hypothetical protein
MIKTERSENMHNNEREIIIQCIKDFEAGNIPEPFCTDVKHVFDCVWFTTSLVPVHFALTSKHFLRVQTTQGYYLFWKP